MATHISRSSPGLVLFVSTLLFIGCGTDPANPGSGSDATSLLDALPWDKVSISTHGQLFVTSRRTGFGDPVYHSGAQVFSSTEHTPPEIDGGDAVVSGLNVSFNPSHGYLSVAQPIFGSTASWSLAGNSTHGIPALSETMYMPAEIQISMPAPTPQATISKGGDLTVSWNADLNSDDVVLGFEYLPNDSRFVDPTLPDIDVRWFEMTEDDGNYIISSGELTELPVGGIVRLAIARGNTKVMGASTHKFHLYGYTIAEGIFQITE